MYHYTTEPADALPSYIGPDAFWTLPLRVIIGQMPSEPCLLESCGQMPAEPFLLES